MSEQPFPYPASNEPLRRLHVYDSLMMNAERWQLAHYYHRKRQNLLYQALYQPGIIYGLGVKVIEPPTDSIGAYRKKDEENAEQRWIVIQPGVAIDLEGNLIIVDDQTDRAYRIAANAPVRGALTIYIVVSFVEPDTLEHQPHEVTLPERFRFDQKTEPPNAREIELCRVQVQAGRICLEMPEAPLFPKMNQIDLRYRMQAQMRSHGYVRLGTIEQLPNATYENFSYLMQALTTLFPTLQGCVETQADPLSQSIPTDFCDLLYLSPRKFLELKDESSLNQLRRYLDTGGVILIELAESDLGLKSIIQERFKQVLPTQVLQDWETLPAQHPLKTKPFLFSELPTLSGAQIKIHASNQGQLILVTGVLSSSWGIQKSLPRNDIRTAQELGINLLHFAWQQRSFSHLLQ